MQTRFATLPTAGRFAFSEEDLVPGPGQVLVRVEACGICRGDVRGFLAGPRPGRMGHEPVGDVVEVGPGVDRVAVGDRVVGTLYGSFGTHVLADQREVYRISRDLGALACLAEPIKCVTTVVRAARPDFGDAVAVVGCGFMGLCAICALAGNRSVAAVIAVDPAESRRKLALELGATHTVDAKQAEAEARAITGGAGVDVAIEFAGGSEAPNLAASLPRTRGRLVLAGGGNISAQIYGKALTVMHASPAFSPDEADDYRRTIAAMERGVFPLEKLVTHRFRLSEIQTAFETVAREGGRCLKGMVLAE